MPEPQRPTESVSNEANADSTDFNGNVGDIRFLRPTCYFLAMEIFRP
jgi:hypothetical protein